ncbi:unnamed protein product, partial [marine sediment metagenome]
SVYVREAKDQGKSPHDSPVALVGTSAKGTQAEAGA